MIRIIIILLFALPCFASDVDEAIKMSAKAFMKYPKVRQMRKNLENTIYRKIPIPKKTIKVIVPTTLSLLRGEINTKYIKKMNIKLLNGRLRPDMHYNIRKKSMKTSVNMNWKF